MSVRRLADALMLLLLVVAIGVLSHVATRRPDQHPHALPKWRWPQRRDQLDPRAVSQLLAFADAPEPHTIHGFGCCFLARGAAPSRSRTSGGMCSLALLISSSPSSIAACALRTTCSPHVVGSKFICSTLGLPFASVQLLPIAVDSATRQYSPEQNL